MKALIVCFGIAVISSYATSEAQSQLHTRRKSLCSFAVPISELVDCDKLDNGCGGGFFNTAFEAIEKLGGLETEDDYPYEGRNDQCTLNKSEIRVSVRDYVNITTDETEIAKYLVGNGPISIGINANAMQDELEVSEVAVYQLETVYQLWNSQQEPSPPSSNCVFVITTSNKQPSITCLVLRHCNASLATTVRMEGSARSSHSLGLVIVWLSWSRSSSGSRRLSGRQEITISLRPLNSRSLAESSAMETCEMR
ncbi:unnamed protein product, partial [Nesidiocoris tenuis]